MKYQNCTLERLKHKIAEKVAIAVNLNAELEKYTKKLDNDLILFDAEYLAL